MKPSREVLKLITGILLALSMTAGAADDEAVLTLFFRDSDTGAAVAPDSVTVDGKEMRPAVQYPSGKLVLLTGVGDHNVVVRARGYKEMVTKETAVADTPPKHILHLDPESPPPDLRSKALTDMMTTGVGLITGYVIDDKSGLPVADVEVQVKDGAAVRTNPRGFFVAEIQVPTEKTLPEQADRFFTKKDFTFSQAGYDTEERVNVSVVTGEQKTMKIRLKAGSGVNMEDEDALRGNLLAPIKHGDHAGHNHAKAGSKPADVQTTATDTSTTATK